MADEQTRGAGSYASPEIEQFLEATYAEPDPALGEALRALDRDGMPKIQISALDGRILRLLMRAVRAEKVVELGTLSGYSALWILKGLPPAGHLWTCEKDPQHARAAREVLASAGVDDRVTLLEGDGRQLIDRLARHAPFDAVFIDADKSGYELYARWAFDHLRSGGLIVADNAFLFGRLVPGTGQTARDDVGDAERDAVQGLHRFLADSCVAACLPTPDGLAVGLKP
jgi:caffeoyl-CoA O-methyltransferase